MKGRQLVSDILATILICQCVPQIENEKPEITDRVIRKISGKVFDRNSSFNHVQMRKNACVQINFLQFWKTNTLCFKTTLMVPEL